MEALQEVRNARQYKILTPVSPAEQLNAAFFNLNLKLLLAKVALFIPMTHGKIICSINNLST